MTVANVEVSKGIATVTMDRPDALNAFNNQMMDDLCEAFLAVTDDDSAKVLVLTGAVRAFSAGADVVPLPSEACECMSQKPEISVPPSPSKTVRPAGMLLRPS